MSIVDAAARRFDGWMNVMTGLGRVVRDKLVNTRFLQDAQLDEVTLEALFDFDDMARRIVMRLPDHAFRQGFDLAIDASEGMAEAQDMGSDVLEAYRRMHAHEKLFAASVWGRLFGGGFLFVGADDGSRDIGRPLNEEAIRSIRFLEVIDRRDMVIDSYFSDPLSPDYGLPEVYSVHSTHPHGIGEGVRAQGRRIHASRLIHFGGALTSRRKQRENNGWDLSVLDSVHPVLRLFQSNWGSAANMMTDGSVGIFKIEGLMDMITSRPEVLQQRMQIVDQAKSMLRSLLLDAEREDFSFAERTFTGVDAMLDRSNVRLAAAADMPVTVLMGQSPAGMNATGESDRTIWEDSVKAWQTNALRSRVERMLELIMLAQDGPTGGVVPDVWKVEFRPVRQPTPKEQAELRKLVADTDVLYIGKQVLLPEEVAINRFRPEGWSAETSIELADRESILEAEMERAVENAENPPEPPPMLPPQPDEEGGQGGPPQPGENPDDDQGEEPEEDDDE